MNSDTVVPLSTPAGPAAQDERPISVEEFCSRYGIGRSTYRRMQRQKTGPRELRIGLRVMITVRAVREWEDRTVESGGASTQESSDE
ncbi:hypothetical protein B0G84_4371 [Paraburkholderia sp. BL8N3]|jgi:predicted DNA-binding transcriptional regulator AlpA|nr:hypothetical protein [Paraburkholderia sp. BL8N3]TCK39043.1 hypothetical protein B0G84_4371 [Paraburkholderia sp. BL8N3]